MPGTCNQSYQPHGICHIQFECGNYSELILINKRPYITTSSIWNGVGIMVLPNNDYFWRWWWKYHHIYAKISQILSIDVLRANRHAMSNLLHGNKNFHTYWQDFKNFNLFRKFSELPRRARSNLALTYDKEDETDCSKICGYDCILVKFTFV